ncbi:MAG: hypothetical protein JSW59_10740 [Phycisphaerales bacterium]|nr:MAG: hypothetical protein JSW59_10740 [Phycisphaerales bacterium]
MKSSRQIEKIVGRARARAGRATDERILPSAEDALIHSSHNRPQAVRPGLILWRLIMESKVTRYSAAAVAGLAMALVLFSPFGTSDNGGIVWAKVVQNIDNAQMIVHKEKRFYYELGEEEPFLKTDVIKHVSPKYGVVDEQYTDNGKLMHRVFVLGEPQEIVCMLPEAKKYFKMPISDGMVQLIDRLTPRGLVEYFMSKEHKELGRSRIDGREVEGFEVRDIEIWPIHDKFHFLFPVKQMMGRFWIDVESSLPVRAEYEVITDRGLLTGMKKLRVVCKAYDLEYHQQAQEELFDPNIPEDYTEFKLTDLIPAEAKAGLVGLGIIPLWFVFWRRRRRKRATVS